MSSTHKKKSKTVSSIINSTSIKLGRGQEQKAFLERKHQLPFALWETLKIKTKHTTSTKAHTSSQINGRKVPPHPGRPRSGLWTGGPGSRGARTTRDRRNRKNESSPADAVGPTRRAWTSRESQGSRGLSERPPRAPVVPRPQFPHL